MRGLTAKASAWEAAFEGEFEGLQASEDAIGDEVKEGMMKGHTIHFDSPFGELPPLPPLAPPPPHEQEQDTMEEPARTEVCGREWESVSSDENEVMEEYEACGAADGPGEDDRVSQPPPPPSTHPTTPQYAPLTCTAPPAHTIGLPAVQPWPPMGCPLPPHMPPHANTHPTYSTRHRKGPTAREGKS